MLNLHLCINQNLKNIKYSSRNQFFINFESGSTTINWVVRCLVWALETVFGQKRRFSRWIRSSVKPFFFQNFLWNVDYPWWRKFCIFFVHITVTYKRISMVYVIKVRSISFSDASMNLNSIAWKHSYYIIPIDLPFIVIIKHFVLLYTNLVTLKMTP